MSVSGPGRKINPYRFLPLNRQGVKAEHMEPQEHPSRLSTRILGLTRHHSAFQTQRGQ